MPGPKITLLWDQVGEGQMVHAIISLFVVLPLSSPSVKGKKKNVLSNIFGSILVSFITSIGIGGEKWILG